MNERMANAPVGILEASPDGIVDALNRAAGTVLEVDPGSVVGHRIGEVFPRSVDDTVPRAFEEGVSEERSVEEYYPELDRWLAVTIVPTDGAVTLYLRDRTERRRTERTIERLRNDVDRLVVTNELISDLLGELVEASTREEIAETICERLGATDLYEFAWFGERELGGDGLVVRGAAGEGGRTLERITELLDGSATIPEQRAIETATPQVVHSIGEDPSVPETVRRAAFADGLQSSLAIPLTYGSSVHGVIGVYAADRDAFSDRERASFTTVGEMAGFAVTAARHRTLLLSDTVVELAIEVTDPDAPMVATATDLDAELELAGLVSGSDERVLCYLSVDEVPERVERALADTDGVVDTREVADHGDGGSVEVTLGDATPLGLLASLGVTVRSAGFEPGVGRIEVDLPPEEDVRRVADAVTGRFDAEVVAKRERERSTTTARAFREELHDRLTDHQENALRTAFLADYFESPRGSTAEEVAEALEITGPTLLYHLRAGERKLLEAFFDHEAREPNH